MKLTPFAVKSQPAIVDLLLLAIRTLCGYAFVRHGWSKIQDPLHWMGNDSAVPALFQALAAISEFGGGFALLIGLLTRLGALGIACTMAVATYMHRFVFGDPYLSLTGGRSFELAANYLMLALLILVNGPGRFSLDRLIFGKSSRQAPPR
jgi:putative oxidoreductase